MSTIKTRLTKLEAILGQNGGYPVGPIEAFLKTLPPFMLSALRRGCFPVGRAIDEIDAAARLRPSDLWALLTVGTEYEDRPMPQHWPGARWFLGPEKSQPGDTESGLGDFSEQELARLYARTAGERHEP